MSSPPPPPSSSSGHFQPMNMFTRTLVLVIFLSIVWLLIDGKEEDSINTALMKDSKGLKKMNENAGPVNGSVPSEASTIHPVTERYDESAASLMEHLNILDNEASLNDAANLCKELLARSKGIHEGDEPWREHGLLFIPNDCQDPGATKIGNHLSRWYLLRLIASAAGVTIQSTCDSPVSNRMQGQRTFIPDDMKIDAADTFSWRNACKRCLVDCTWPHREQHSDLYHALSTIRFDLQGMADQIMMKSRDIEVDEMAIHLRCGDIGRQNDSLYGLVPVHVYTKYIPKTATSIGIVTPPFGQDQGTGGCGDSDLHETVVRGVQEMLQAAYPGANVTIRNDINEPMGVTFARQIVARTIICGPSTFCLFPAIATMGQSYIVHSPLFGDSPNWLDILANDGLDRINYVNDSYIQSSEISNFDASKILQMLRKDLDEENAQNMHLSEPVMIHKNNGTSSEGFDVKELSIPDEEGFFVDTTNLCKKLLDWTHGLPEGQEPWRANGLTFFPNDCAEQGTSVLGNHLSRWYLLRLIASGAGITLKSTCNSPVTKRIQDERMFLPTDTVIDDANSFSWRKGCEVCSEGCRWPHGEKDSDLYHASSMIRADLQGLAEEVLSESPNLEIDEVAIHVRVGDIARQNHALYGLVPYHVYCGYIPNGVKSIGLVTAPFKQDRWGWGYGDSDVNQAVVTGALEYLQAAFPHANVTIRNDVNEAMDVTYARLVKASILVCGPSTFCLYPAIATMGQSYILHSPLFGDSPTWLDILPNNEPARVHYVDDAYVPSTEIFNLNASDIVQLLRKDHNEEDQRIEDPKND